MFGFCLNNFARSTSAPTTYPKTLDLSTTSSPRFFRTSLARSIMDASTTTWHLVMIILRLSMNFALYLGSNITFSSNGVAIVIMQSLIRGGIIIAANKTLPFRRLEQFVSQMMFSFAEFAPSFVVAQSGKHRVPMNNLVADSFDSLLITIKAVVSKIDGLRGVAIGIEMKTYEFGPIWSPMWNLCI